MTRSEVQRPSDVAKQAAKSPPWAEAQHPRQKYQASQGKIYIEMRNPRLGDLDLVGPWMHFPPYHDKLEPVTAEPLPGGVYQLQADTSIGSGSLELHVALPHS